MSGGPEGPDIKLHEAGELKNEHRKEEPERDPVLEQQVKPVGDKLFCRRLDKKEEIKDGIIIPDVSAEKEQNAEVIAAGPGRVTPEGKLVPTTIKPGMYVILPKFGGAEVSIKGVKYQIVTEPEVLAIVGNPQKQEKTEDE